MNPRRPPFQFSAVILVVALYVMLVLTCVLSLARAKVPLYDGVGFFLFPNRTLLLVYFLYYVLPVVFGLLAGVMWRPFARQFLAVTLLIYAGHLVFSLAVLALRHNYLVQHFARQYDVTNVVWGKSSLRCLPQDLSADDLVDNVSCEGELDIGGWPTGQFSLFLLFTQAGQEGAPGYPVGNFSFQKNTEVEESRSFQIDVDPVRLKDLSLSGKVSVNARITRDVLLDDFGSKIIAVSRWAAFLRKTDWNGADPSLYEDMIDAALVPVVFEFDFDPQKVQRPQVVFLGFLGDEGRDLDQDGIFDQLVLRLEVDSIYAGPVYFQGSWGVQGQFFLGKAEMAKGIVPVELIVPKNEILKLRTPGPYIIKNFAFVNNDPYCPGGRCVMKHQPPFSVYLPDYQTREYRLEDFGEPTSLSGEKE